MLVPYFVVHCFVSFSFCNHLDGEDRADCLDLFVFPMSCDCYSLVTLPHDVVVWSVGCG